MVVYWISKYGTVVSGRIEGFNDNIYSILAETSGIKVRNNVAIINISGKHFSRATVNYHQ